MNNSSVFKFYNANKHLIEHNEFYYISIGPQNSLFSLDVRNEYSHFLTVFLLFV